MGHVGSGDHDRSAVLVGDGERAVRRQVKLPVVAMDLVVMPGADGNEVVKIGRPVVFPRDDVVHFATFEQHLAAVGGAGAVHRSQGSAL